ncbi:histidine phosphatase family protein [Patescibacteria group bacterium]|nr:histidine phosphatase family protein [Patescibacteria group bacterium]
MAKLFLLRHFKSQWNLENRFSGWTDMPISEIGKKDASKKAKQVFKFKIDEIYTSPLFRNLDTVVRLLEAGKQKYPIFIPRDGGRKQKWGDFFEGPKNYIPVYVTENLNERHYGSLEGLNKEEIIKKYGEEKVHLWRRSYEVAPPGGGESLKDVCKRVNPFYKKYIEKSLKEGKNILVVGSHNSLRAIVKYVEKILDKEIINLEIEYGGLLEYDFKGADLLKKN